MSAIVQGVISRGTSGMVVDIECSLSNNLPNIIIVGFANRAVDEAKERIRGAFADSNLIVPRKRVTINLAPADVPKADSGYDLAIAMAILLASEQIPPLITKQQAFIGELGLDGSTRAVRGIIGKILAGRARGIKQFFIPSANLKQAQLVPNVTLVPVEDLRQLYAHMMLVGQLKAVRTGNGKYVQRHKATSVSVQLSEVVGQLQAKRALEVAAAGGHNVFFSGPPGTGKSMLAKALPSILPPLNREEILEVTHLHSLVSHKYDQIIFERPFRTPHHSASHIAVIGGGTHLRPGEISLAHRGVLFFDELPEFERITLEALRQPLEDRVISVARAKDTAEYPANFILIGTANPCPCGYYGTRHNKCRCNDYQIKTYRNRLSGPIIDRIDLFSQVHIIEHEKLLTQAADPQADNKLRRRIQQARQIQAKRYQSQSKLNTDMTNADVKQFGHLSTAAISLLNNAAQNMNISARSYMRTVKVARTLADLEASQAITEAHVSEALAYRGHFYKQPQV